MVKSLNKYFILFIIIIACSGGGESPTDSGDDNGGDNTNPYELPNAVDYGLSNQVEIVTWNIRQFPQHSSTKDYVKNLMQKWNADIYFFQEMRSESELISMVDTMPNYSYVFDEESGNLGFALVYKKLNPSKKLCLKFPFHQLKLLDIFPRSGHLRQNFSIFVKNCAKKQ